MSLPVTLEGGASFEGRPDFLRSQARSRDHQDRID